MKFLKNLLKITIVVTLFLLLIAYCGIGMSRGHEWIILFMIPFGIILLSLETTYPRIIEKTIERFIKW